MNQIKKENNKMSEFIIDGDKALFLQLDDINFKLEKISEILANSINIQNETATKEKKCKTIQGVTLPEEVPISDRIANLLEQMLVEQRSTTSLISQLVKAAETELVDLKFDTGIKTLTNGVATEPDIDNITATGYTQEPIFNILRRTSPELYLINLGTGLIYTRISKGYAPSGFSTETAIFEGATRVFYDVYEVRLRSPVAGTQYILTEYEPTNPAKTFVITTTSTLNGWNLKRTDITYELSNSFSVNTIQTVPIPTAIADGLEISKISLFFSNANAKDVRIYFNLGGFGAAVHETQYSVNADTALSVVIVFGDQYRYNELDNITIQTLNGTPPQTIYALVTLKRMV